MNDVHAATESHRHRALPHTVLTGALASGLSMLVLAARGRKEAGSAAAAVSAPSHWIYGDEALHVQRPTWRHTLPGALIHHGSSLLWAYLYEKVVCRHGRRTSLTELTAGAAGVTALAAVVDLKLTPERFTPGFERRLSRQSLVLTYGAFAAGLLAGGLWLHRRHH